MLNRCKRSAGRAHSIDACSDIIPQQQSRQFHEVGPDISLLTAELQAQWHEKLNRHLGHFLIKPYSHRKVWWSCDQCPDGFSHLWEASVGNRASGTGCPFCSGTAVCQHNTLATNAPQIALFWDAKKNHPLSPDQVTVFSYMRAHWKCSNCLYEWQSSVVNKTVDKTGCPKCAKANYGRQADSTRQKHPTFAIAQHALLKQRDHDRKKENGNYPDNTTLQSNKLIWWQCHECPKGKVHSWQAPAYNRTSEKRKATGCPICDGHIFCQCSSLETVCPDVAADFDTKKNGVSPAEDTISTCTEYSWLSDKPGAKKRSVAQCTMYTRKQVKTISRRT